MCYFLYIASPLTLSEVRSMLPRGVQADLADFTEQQVLKSLHPGAQTVARLLIGRCSCDFMRPRLSDTREDERHLRERYRRLDAPRAMVITALERHRRAPNHRAPEVDWAEALAKFVAEHARNAGPTLYYLHFSLESATLGTPGPVRGLTEAEPLAAPRGWLLEDSPSLVARRVR
jgi:hypothetical protein